MGNKILMILKEIIFVTATFLMNTLKSIFKPDPDLRYKFYLDKKKKLVKNKLDTELCHVKITDSYEIEVHVDDEKINLFNKDNHYCGLPIIAVKRTKIVMIDAFNGSVIDTFSYEKGELVNYTEIHEKHELFS